MSLLASFCSLFPKTLDFPLGSNVPDNLGLPLEIFYRRTNFSVVFESSGNIYFLIFFYLVFDDIFVITASMQAPAACSRHEATYRVTPDTLVI